MREIGLNAYRFSVSWSRVLPAGTGRSNRPGLDHYERLVDALLDAGIAPSLTLYHWDLPAALDDRGGWLNRDIASWFADYATVLVRALGDRVPFWATLNEPWVIMDAGYVHGAHAPGHAALAEAPVVAHNLLRAHAAGVDAFRAEARSGQVGLVVNIEPKYPARDCDADLGAVARADAYMNRFFLEPAILGRYPEALAPIFGQDWPTANVAETAALARPLDFVGVNYYSRNVVEDDPAAPPLRATRVRQPQNPHTALDWEVFPQGLCDALAQVRATTGKLPLYITENGAAFTEPATARVEPLPDPRRVDYLRQHLRALHRALADGAPVRGYFAWSLLDNFEWAEGFSKRFGLVHVDFGSQRRTLKQSARFYADVIASNGEALE
jgi:beta-glucosidase